MKFYRLEHKETKGGIYRSNPGIWLDTDDRRHPMPFNDSKLVREGMGKIFTKYEDFEGCFFNSRGYDYIFGFESADQYRSWFYSDEFLSLAVEKGFSLNLYETEDFFLGNTQMVARKETLVLVGECDVFSGELVSFLPEKVKSKRVRKNKQIISCNPPSSVV